MTPANSVTQPRVAVQRDVAAEVEHDPRVGAYDTAISTLASWLAYAPPPSSM